MGEILRTRSTIYKYQGMRADNFMFCLETNASWKSVAISGEGFVNPVTKFSFGFSIKKDFSQNNTLLVVNSYGNPLFSPIYYEGPVEAIELPLAQYLLARFGLTSFDNLTEDLPSQMVEAVESVISPYNNLAHLVEPKNEVIEEDTSRYSLIADLQQ